MLQQLLVILVFAIALGYLVTKFIWKPAFLKKNNSDEGGACGKNGSDCGCH